MRTLGTLTRAAAAALAAALSPALPAGEKTTALEEKALTAASRGLYLEAQVWAGRALEAQVGEEWSDADQDRATAHFLLALVGDMARQSGDSPAALQLLTRLRSQSPALAVDAVLAAAVDLKRQELLEACCRWKEARALNGPLGLLCRWRLIGPFDNERGRGFARSFPPEEEIDLAAAHDGARRPVAWRAVDVAGVPGGVVDLSALLRPATEALAYAATCVFVEAPTDALLRAGSGGSIAVWVNGRPVLAADARRPWRPDQDQGACRLKAGANIVLVKTATQQDPWRFSLRLCAPNGGPLPHRCEDDPAALAGPVPAAEEGPGPCSPAPLELMAALYEREPEACLAFRRAYLLRLLHPFDENDRQDREWARRAAAAAPGRPVFRLLHARTLSRQDGLAAEKDENPSRREYEETLRLDPDCAEACLALARLYKDGQGNPTRALELADRALAINPAFIPAGLTRAAVLAGLEGGATARLLQEELAGSPPGRLHPELNLELARDAAARGNPGRALALLEDLFARAATADLATQVARARVAAGRPDEALALLDQAGQAWPLAHAPRLARAELCRARRDLDGARSALVGVLVLCPEEDQVLITLADLEGEAGNTGTMVEFYRRALACSPGLERVKRHLDFLEADEKPFYAGLAVDTPAFLAAAPAPPKDAKERNDSHDYLLRHKVVRANPDGTSQAYEHLLVRILTEEGARRFATFTETFFGGDQTGRILAARVVHPDGREERARIMPFLTGLEGLGRIAVNLPPSRPGDVVEVAYRIDELKPSFFGDYFGLRHLFGATDGAVVHQARLDIVAPRGRHLGLHLLNGAPAPQERDLPGDLKLRSWRLEGLARVARENNMPEAQELVPGVEISSYRDWDEFARWWWNLIRRQYDSSPDMEEKVGELLAGARTEAEKIQAIYRFVVTDVRYVAWEFGVHGYKPYSAATIFSRRHGDCKDKAILLGAMLARAGIQAWPVLIRGEESRSRDDLTLPLVDHFNHCIAYVPPIGDWPGGFLDGTASYHEATSLPDMDRGARVIAVMGERAREMEIPWSDPAANVDHQEYLVRLEPTGDAEVTFTGRPQENQGAYVRALFGNEPGRRRELLETRFSRLLGRVTVEEMEFSDLLDLGTPVAWKARMKVRELAERRDGLLVLKAGFDPAGWNRLAAAADRRHDLLLVNPWTDRFVVRYVLPPGWQPVSLPAGAAEETDAAAFRVTWRREGDDVVVETVRTLKKQRIRSTEYEAFRDMAVRLEAAESQVLLIGPGPGQGR